MATSKTDKPESKPEAKTEAKTATTNTKASPRKADASFHEQAATFAGDLRAAAQEMTERLNELTEQRGTLMRGTVPEVADEAAADALRRLPMPLAEATRAVATLASIGADLGNKAV